MATHLMADELRAMGAKNVRISEYGYVYAVIPASAFCEKANIPKLGFIAHMDTAPSLTGRNVRPQIIKNYDGQVIFLGILKSLIEPSVLVLHRMRSGTQLFWLTTWE